MKFRALVLGGLVAASTLAGTVTSPASAASYNGSCGSGYRVIDSAAVGSNATMFLTYNNGWNCLVTIRNTKGTAHHMGAYLKRSSVESWQVKNEGNFTHFAGPIYLQAAGSCIDWAGADGTAYNAKYRTHCG
ncbi:spore-associated protein A [Sphaerisporangium fuscum]|uniref:spore-associated protein A n=1 Tax=Sphaerisporangium fuscum TaxID=2835868 RepID=UPI001BDDBEA2|nr:spore-associated protein A [Sphaerisporangium fuscum]